jgi:primary-amine oxidase
MSTPLNEDHEDANKKNWAHNSKEQVLIVNKDALNKYGEEKGYKIMPSRGPPGFHLTITNSTNLQKSGSIGTHAYFVTKHVSHLSIHYIHTLMKQQKDSEKRSVSAWNAYDPGHPLVDFDQFFDGESLDQEDL